MIAVLQASFLFCDKAIHSQRITQPCGDFFYPFTKIYSFLLFNNNI